LSIGRSIRNSRTTVPSILSTYQFASASWTMAAVEKNSETAKVFQRLRSNIRQAGNQAAAQPLPVPIPEATK